MAKNKSEYEHIAVVLLVYSVIMKPHVRNCMMTVCYPQIYTKIKPPD